MAERLREIDERKRSGTDDTYSRGDILNILESQANDKV